MRKKSAMKLSIAVACLVLSGSVVAQPDLQNILNETNNQVQAQGATWRQIAGGIVGLIGTAFFVYAVYTVFMDSQNTRRILTNGILGFILVAIGFALAFLN